LAKPGLPRLDGTVLGPIAASACQANCQISSHLSGGAVAVDVEQQNTASRVKTRVEPNYFKYKIHLKYNII
jgi:hypothetical protein